MFCCLPPTLTLPHKGGGNGFNSAPAPSPLMGEGWGGGDDFGGGDTHIFTIQR